jgi:phospholipid/cholesterol/gamma-HCH transport system permease protein
MPAPETNAGAHAALVADDGLLEVRLSGSWRLTAPTPRWAPPEAGARPARVRLVAAEVPAWDPSLILYLAQARRWCADAGIACDTGGLPEKMRLLSGQFEESARVPAQQEHAHGFVIGVGLATRDCGDQARAILQFVGELYLDAFGVVRGRLGFRWNDCLQEMQKCGAMALPIVSLISFLVGVTVAYSGAIVLRRFGAEIWVADLIGVGMTRELGALMAAITLAGRTGAAFAAEIGSMKANEELDALSTLGISPVRFLIFPRVLALGLMMPLLAIYANCLGILGGMAVSYGVLAIPPAAYWVEMLTIVNVQDIAAGIIKSIAFGLIVGLAGCLRGLQSDRSATGVGNAATSAVVTAILLIVVADAVFAVLFNAVGL